MCVVVRVSVSVSVRIRVRVRVKVVALVCDVQAIYKCVVAVCRRLERE